MHPLYGQFVSLLEGEDKGECVKFALSKLADGSIDVVSLYTELLGRSLNEMVCIGDEEMCIWKEHVRSSIVRAIIESSYPYVVRERDSRYGGRHGGRAIVVCPTEEMHELGARMVADFFTLAGYEAVFIGAFTPLRVVLSAVRHVKPSVLALSVTNYYNLFAARGVISAVKSLGLGGLTVVVGGSAFRGKEDGHKEVGADALLRTFDDIRRLKGAR